MRHCKPEQLALAALREPLPARDADHLAGCAQCQAEVASLRRPVEALAVPPLAAPGPAVPPPPRVWDAIAAATGVTVAPRRELTEEPAPVVVQAPDAVPLRAVPHPVSDDPDAAPGPRVARPRRGRVSGPSRGWLAVAAGLLVGGAVGAGAVAVTTGSDDGGSVVASTALDPLDDLGSSGRAEVRQAATGRVLEVDLDAPELEDGYYEVWLLQSDAQRMVQVGVVQRGATVLPLPEGVDLSTYPLVDVSVEPLDGVPTHSGVSVARGELQT
ncbi:anti-sigma factor domain-containing protein [Modestobacter sp. URMC 112]